MYASRINIENKSFTFFTKFNILVYYLYITTSRSVYLREFLEASANLLLIFIRYYGWPVCRNHVIDLIDHVETLKEHKVKTIVISGGTFEAAQEWKVKASCPFDVLVDEGGKV